MTFLETSTTASEVQKLLAGGGSIRAAVAYWGDGAIEGLGITESQKLTIVCDILSGGCNPAEVRRLQALLGRDRVLTFDRLHAKVWLADKSAIIGSSNASSNGLGFEGGEVRSLVEANLVVDDQATLDVMKKWWNDTILLGAREITESDLRRAKKLRDRLRAIRPLERRHDLLMGLRLEPQSYEGRHLYVWVWEQDELDPWAEDALEDAQETFGEDILCWQDVENPPPPGSYVIDFDSNYDPPVLTGIYRILDEPIYKANEGALLLCKMVQRFEGMPLGHRATWRAAAKAAWHANNKEEWEGEANEFARFIPPS